MKSIYAVILCVLCAGCDTVVLNGGGASNGGAETVTRSPMVRGNTDFTVTGERLETYYRVIDPEIRNKKLTVSLYPKTFAAKSYYNFMNMDEGIDCYNSFNIDASYHDLYTPPFNVRITGEATFPTSGKVTIYDPPDRNGYRAARQADYYFNYSFDTEKSLYDDLGADFNILNEKVSVPDAFSGTSLELPETSSYSNPERKFFVRSIALATDNSFIRSLTGKNPEYGQIYHDIPYLMCDIPGKFFITIIEPFTLESRNFYRYKNISVKYRPEIKIIACDFRSGDIENWNIDGVNNVLTVSLKNYDEPRTGNLVSFWIETPGGGIYEKFLSIR